MDVSSFNKLTELAQNIYFWVVTVIGAVGVTVWRFAKSRRCEFSSLNNYISKRFGMGDDLLVKTAKIMTCVVVDDEPVDFPLEFLRGFFASVSVETLVSLNDARRLADYDVIFLDVAGVVSEDLSRGGAVLINQIRGFRKSGIILSVSSKKYDIEVTDYFANADIRLRKPLQAASVRQQIMAHLRNEAGPAALASYIDERLGTSQGGRLRKKLIECLGMGPASMRKSIPREVLMAGVESQFIELNRLVHGLAK